jgi:hypothetical protein
MSFEHGIEYTATAADNGVMNSGFPARGSMFITPAGYKPMGPVSVFCTNRQECVAVDPVTGPMFFYCQRSLPRREGMVAASLDEANGLHRFRVALLGGEPAMFLGCLGYVDAAVPEK